MLSKSSPSKGHVLVVDDDGFMRGILKQVLENAHYRVTTASDGEEAWSIFSSHRSDFDLVVTDRNMPRMDGMTLLQKIRADKQAKEMPVIFQTGMSSQQDIIDGIKAGVYHYLTKPYDQTVLLALIEAAIRDSIQSKSWKIKSARRQAAFRLLNKAEFQCRTLDDTEELAGLLAEFSDHPGRVVSGLSELLINAVEHGNLEISYDQKTQLMTSGEWRQEIERRLASATYRARLVRVSVNREANRTVYVIKDEGRGFDASKYMSFDPERATDVHGRGIAMSKLMSFTSLEYVGNGNKVIAAIER